MTELDTRPDPTPAVTEVTYAELGLGIPAGLSIDEWSDVGRPIAQTAESTRWWVGDWLVYAFQNFELDDANVPDPVAVAEVRRRVSEVCRLDQASLRGAKWVSAAFPPARRRAELSWSHHLIVAAQDPALADELLELAVRSKWSRAELTAELKRRQAVDAPSVDGGPVDGVAPLRVKLRPFTIDDPTVRDRVVTGIRAVLADAGLDADLLEVA